MQISVHIWSLALVCLLGSHVSGHAGPEDPVTIANSVLDLYVRPFTRPVEEIVTNSRAWNFLSGTMNKVQDAISFTRGYAQTFYEDHLKERAEMAEQWIEKKTNPIIKSVKQLFQTESH